MSRPVACRKMLKYFFGFISVVIETWAAWNLRTFHVISRINDGELRYTSILVLEKIHDLTNKPYFVYCVELDGLVE